MRNLLDKASGTAMAIAAAALLNSGSANALHDGPSKAHVIIDIFGCELGEIFWSGDSDLFTMDTFSVVTPSGNVEFACFFDAPAGQEPAKAEKFGGFGCNTPGGFTTDTSTLSTPGGRVILKCKMNGSS